MADERENPILQAMMNDVNEALSDKTCSCGKSPDGLPPDALKSWWIQNILDCEDGRYFYIKRIRCPEHKPVLRNPGPQD